MVKMLLPTPTDTFIYFKYNFRYYDCIDKKGINMTKRNIYSITCKTLLISSFLFAQNLSAKDLEWTKESAKRINWNDGKKYCKSLNARLPTYEELKVTWLKNNKSSEIEGFDSSVSYWSSRIEKSNYRVAYPFYFGEGEKGWYYKEDHYGVRCIKN
jgi:hypothetical protein